MKKALIVDDSRLARTVLGRLLSEHGVAADMAESAESALDYLKHNRPDVVFLDHNMPGIDGFQALDAIKTNPATATIPVMMYTSEAGEVYLGQARALGALGVLPKTLKPVEVVNVLRRLHLIPGPVPEQPAAPAPAAAPPPAFDAEPLDAARLREILEPLFFEHASSLREEMRLGLQRFAAASAPPPPGVPLEPPPPAPRKSRRSRLAAALLAAIAVTFGYLYFATRGALDDANERVQRLASDAAALSDAAARGAARLASASAAGSSLDDVVTVLEWGVNRGNRYAFGTIPLDDERATMLASLTEQLDRLGFEGRVAIETHVGRFCMNYGSDGMLDLAPPDQPAATCSQIGWPESEAVALGQRQSLAFANAVATSIARHPRIAVQTFSRGNEEPEMDYPATSYELTAGVWNAVAAANHRVVVRIIPEPNATARP
jgi:CheY-like chemotaxis protein